MEVHLSLSFLVKEAQLRLDKRGQTLIEVIVVITIGILVIGALVFATIAGLRNSQFAKNQVQATKLAQEGLERMRTLRDRDNVGSISSSLPGVDQFSDLWSVSLGCQVAINNCYFYFNPSGSILINGTSVNFEDIQPGNFRRQIQIEDYGDGTQQKKVTSIVQWNDFSGDHESRLTTILRQL